MNPASDFQLDSEFDPEKSEISNKLLLFYVFFFILPVDMHEYSIAIYYTMNIETKPGM
jgi:hypothetical protein